MTGQAGAAQPSGPARPGRPVPHITGRAAVLAIVLCAIALSLAYPVREYLAQRRQIDLLVAQRAQIAMRYQRLRQEQARLSDPVYIERLARDRLHMCLPGQTCYVVIDPADRKAKKKGAGAPPEVTPWYARIWSSVQAADGSPGRPKGTG